MVEARRPAQDQTDPTCSKPGNDIGIADVVHEDANGIVTVCKDSGLGTQGSLDVGDRMIQCLVGAIKRGALVILGVEQGDLHAGVSVASLRVAETTAAPLMTRMTRKPASRAHG